jgi:glycosyltransferase involved in cell wall biosynthesis
MGDAAKNSEPFSVAMCVYGRDDPGYFRAAVDSVLNQTVIPDEIVLVVDGPVPEPLDDIINGFKQLKVIRLPSNTGLGNALRVCLAHCSHDIVARMDSDDICVPDRFEKQLSMLRANKSLSIAGGDIAEFIGTPDNTVAIRRVPRSDAEIKKYMKKRNPMNHVTVMFRKADAEKAGGYLESHYNEDYYLWVRMCIKGMIFANLDDTLVYVRVDENTYQRRGGRRYFKSEVKLKKYMLDAKMIGIMGYTANVIQRFIVLLLLPNRVRGWVYRKFARR